jgi:hypothetical protein
MLAMHVELCHSTMKRGFADPYCVVPTKRVFFSLAFFSAQSRMLLQRPSGVPWPLDFENETTSERKM